MIPRTVMTDHVAAVEAEKLLAALDAALDYSAHLALLKAAHRRVRELLDCTLRYRKSVADTAAASAAEQATFDGFSQQLDAAPDDATRLRIIEAAQVEPHRGPAWLDEWKWRRTATCDDWMRRYSAAIRAEG